MILLKYIIIDWAGTVLRNHGPFSSAALALSYIKATFSQEEQPELLVIEIPESELK